MANILHDSYVILFPDSKLICVNNRNQRIYCIWRLQNFASFNQACAGFLKHHEKFEDIFFKNQFSKSPFGVDEAGALQQRRGRGGGSQGAQIGIVFTER